MLEKCATLKSIPMQPFAANLRHRQVLQVLSPYDDRRTELLPEQAPDRTRVQPHIHTRHVHRCGRLNVVRSLWPLARCTSELIKRPRPCPQAACSALALQRPSRCPGTCDEVCAGLHTAAELHRHQHAMTVGAARKHQHAPELHGAHLHGCDGSLASALTLRATRSPLPHRVTTQIMSKAMTLLDKWGITPVLVFDGQAPPQKDQTLQIRSA